MSGRGNEDGSTKRMEETREGQDEMKNRREKTRNYWMNKDKKMKKKAKIVMNRKGRRR